MDLPDLKSLPPWAVILFVACVAIIFVATRTGWFDGIKSGGASQSHAQVAAVIVDPAALNAATAAVTALNATMAKISEQLGTYLESMVHERDQADKDRWLREELAALGVVPGGRRPARRRAAKRTPPPSLGG